MKKIIGKCSLCNVGATKDNLFIYNPTLKERLDDKKNRNLTSTKKHAIGICSGCGVALIPPEIKDDEVKLLIDI